MTTEQKVHALNLKTEDVFQILDALESRATAWESTEDSLRGEASEDDFFIPEDCSDANEADAIATHFRDIIRTIEEKTQTRT